MMTSFFSFQNQFYSGDNEYFSWTLLFINTRNIWSLNIDNKLFYLDNQDSQLNEDVISGLL